MFLFNYQCNSCGKQFSPLKMEKIITEGYWPGSPTQLNHVFSEDVFKLWDSVRKNMPGTSETAFLRSLGILSSDKGRVCRTVMFIKYINFLKYINSYYLSYIRVHLY